MSSRTAPDIIELDNAQLEALVLRERAPEPWGSIREQVLMRHSEEPISPLRQPVDGDRVASV